MKEDREGYPLPRKNNRDGKATHRTQPVATLHCFTARWRERNIPRRRAQGINEETHVVASRRVCAKANSHKQPGTIHLITGGVLSLSQRLFRITRLHLFGRLLLLLFLLLLRGRLLLLLLSLLLDQLDRQNDVQDGQRDGDEHERQNLYIKHFSQ